MSDQGAPDPIAVIQSRAYLRLLALSALIGIPISTLAYFALEVDPGSARMGIRLIPDALGVDSMADWWPIVPLTLAGLAVGLVVTRLPGNGGETPIDGFGNSGVTKASWIPGIALAALVDIGLGAVVGPEGPLIGLGSGVAVWLARRASPNLTDQPAMVISAAGSFAAVSTLLGSPLTGAFLMMEAAGLGGAAMYMVLIPGLLSAGIGYLIFLGLDSLTGFGTFSLAIPSLPAFSGITITELALAVGIGLVSPLIALAIRQFSTTLRPLIQRQVLVATTLAGLAIGLLAALYSVLTDESFNFVLFSGQDQLGPLIANESSLTTSALLLMILIKSLAYGVSLCSFRGGMTFPAMFIGAAMGIQLSHWTDSPMVATVAMGIAAMTVAMLRMPFVSVLLATLLMGVDGIAVMPLVIVAVVLSFVVSMKIQPVHPIPNPSTR